LLLNAVVKNTIIAGHNALFHCSFSFYLHLEKGTETNVSLLSQKTIYEEEKSWILAARDQPEAFAPLYERYFKPIYIFINRRVANPDLAGDLTSQTFTKALVNVRKYEFRGLPFSAWLYRIALNEVNMHFRKASKHVEVDLPIHLVDSMIETMEEHPDEERRTRVVEAMNELKFDQVELIEMRFFENRRFKEIGDILGITEENAKMRVYRAVNKLRSAVTGK
jgi:RNA polymerase sigma-70 factor (ECF subfamily)